MKRLFIPAVLVLMAMGLSGCGLISAFFDPSDVKGAISYGTGVYKVTFDSQGGSSVPSQNIARGSVVIQPSDPTRSAASFLGWYKESTGTHSWVFSQDKVYSNITIYAKWMTASPGLVYALTNGGTEYSVTGGSSTNGTVVIPDVWLGKPVTTIGFYAFPSSIYMSNLILPSGLTTIGDSAFFGCSGLKVLTIPSGLAIIAYRGFYSSGITNLTLPAGLTNIGGEAFAFCSGLKSLTMLCTNAPTLGTTPFSSVSGCILHIYSGATGYNVAPWTTTSIFSSIVTDL